MTATTQDRMTPRRFTERSIVFPLKAAEFIPVGVMTMVESPSTGLRNAADVAGGLVQGVSEQQVSAAAGDDKALVARGVFKMNNNGSITNANRGQLCFVVDNQTVGMSTTNSVGAGFVDEVEADGVFVSMLGGKIAAT